MGGADARPCLVLFFGFFTVGKCGGGRKEEGEARGGNHVAKWLIRKDCPPCQVTRTSVRYSKRCELDGWIGEVR